MEMSRTSTEKNTEMIRPLKFAYEKREIGPLAGNVGDMKQKEGKEHELLCLSLFLAPSRQYRRATPLDSELLRRLE